MLISKERLRNLYWNERLLQREIGGTSEEKTIESNQKDKTTGSRKFNREGV